MGGTIDENEEDTTSTTTIYSKEDKKNDLQRDKSSSFERNYSTGGEDAIESLGVCPLLNPRRRVLSKDRVLVSIVGCGTTRSISSWS